MRAITGHDSGSRHPGGIGDLGHRRTRTSPCRPCAESDQRRDDGHAVRDHADAAKWNTEVAGAGKVAKVHGATTVAASVTWSPGPPEPGEMRGCYGERLTPSGCLSWLFNGNYTLTQLYPASRGKRTLHLDVGNVAVQNKGATPRARDPARRRPGRGRRAGHGQQHAPRRLPSPIQNNGLLPIFSQTTPVHGGRLRRRPVRLAADAGRGQPGPLLEPEHADVPGRRLPARHAGRVHELLQPDLRAATRTSRCRRSATTSTSS